MLQYEDGRAALELTAQDLISDRPQGGPVL